MIDKAFLEGVGITDAETVKQITDTYAADIQAEKDAVATVQTQLETANTTIQSYKDMDIDGIKKSAADWQKKYEDAEKERKAQAYSDSLDKFVQKQGMRNDIYAAHLKQQLADKQLKFDDNGVLLGGDDVVKALRESCPDAFAPNPNERAAAPTSQHPPTSMDGVERAFYAKNPDLKPE